METDFPTPVEKGEASGPKRDRDPNDEEEEDYEDDDSDYDTDIEHFDERCSDLNWRKEYFQTHGDCQVEVFQVIINKPGYVYGKVLIYNASRTTDVYRRYPGNEELVPQGGGSLLLTGPNMGLLTVGMFNIYVDLTHKPLGSSLEPSTRLTNCVGGLGENVKFISELKYDGFNWHFDRGGKVNTPFEEKVSNGDLSATVYFTFFQYAIMATLEVRLINQTTTAEVYGHITAKNTMFLKDPHYRCTLFRKQSAEKVQVAPGEPIPLSRYVLAVPVKYKLILDFNLESEDTNLPLGELIIIPPKRFSGSSTLVLGDKVEVNVTWKHTWQQNCFLEAGEIDP